MSSPTIVLIHGLFLNHQSWEGWIERYRSRGCNAVALPWPGLDRTVDELREETDALTVLSIGNVLASLEAQVREISPAPIVIGHSFGGLFAQLLAYRGYGSAVVGVHATAPAGVLDLPFSTLKASAPVLANPLNIGRATMLTAEQFHYAFTNTLSSEDALPLYERYAIPCANRVLFEGAFENFIPGSVAHIDAGSERAPIMLITGSADHLVTAGYTRANCEMIRRSPSPTTLLEFPDRPHFTGVVPGWEAVADAALDWALSAAAGVTP